jgi:hypothetical protein
MSRTTDLSEAAAIVQRMCPVILATVPSRSGATAATLRQLVGDLHTNAASYLDGLTFVANLVACMDQARAAGAGLVQIGALRRAALTEVPASVFAVATVFALVRVSLAQESLVLSQTTFTSRDDAAAAEAVMMAAFDQATDAASDALDAASYMSMLTLQASVSRYFSDLQRKLPRVIAYEYARVMPALRMSQRAYGDGSRSDELRLENRVVHPAFMPKRGKMLAV